ncbi:DUF559 domain-containing protein [Aestuariimicrobium ganziense]|uniref:DUF559 domain-containing protein n=1 Tax=Aestuariimicrobium ganziense TaxID=2773677 RepID=UPI0019453F46|nr:DUF559 domain-containing protein [Aestuariimicrobium ganziense]
MRAAKNPGPELISLLRAQAGVATTRQLRDKGFGPSSTKRWVDARGWVDLGRGVFADSSPSFTGLCWAGVLLAGPDAIVGGDAALHLHGLGPRPQVIDIHASDLVHRVHQPEHWRFRRIPQLGSGTPPRANPGVAFLDHLDAVQDEGDVITKLAELLHQRHDLRRYLAHLVRERTRQRHRGLLRELLEGTMVGIASPLELRYLRMERLHGLPEGSRQASLDGGRFVDVLYEKYSLITELDGAAHHGGARNARDARRDRRHALQGAHTNRVTYADLVPSHCELARDTAMLLRHRGWPGPDGLITCVHCRRLPQFEARGDQAA